MTINLNRKTLTGSTLAVLAVVFLSTVLLSNYLFRLKIDLTSNQLYTLSSGSTAILKKLDEPITLTLYFSDKTTTESKRTEVQELRRYYERVRELLEEIVAQSSDHIKLTVIDPVPYTETEDKAAAYGLQGLPIGNAGENIFFGLVGTNSLDGQSAIPFLSPEKEKFLEYDVMKMVQGLNAGKQPVVGFLSGLDVSAKVDKFRRELMDPWAFYQLLTRSFDVRNIDSQKDTSIDGSINTLVVVHPKSLKKEMVYAIDQFVLRGGRLMMFVDPNAEQDLPSLEEPTSTTLKQDTKSSDIPELFKAWGIDYSPNEVVLDKTHSVEVSLGNGAAPVRHPGMIRIPRADVSTDDIVNANLDALHFSSAGHFRAQKDSAYQLTPLIQSSDQSMVVESKKVQFLGDPSILMSGFSPTGEHYILAGRIKGRFKTAFPERSDANHIAEAKDTAEVFLVADTDFLSDRVWVTIQNFFNQKTMNAFASNGDWFINGVDNLSGSPELISIRGKGTSSKPFTTVEKIKLAADTRFKSKEHELQKELEETEKKLEKLQTEKSKDGNIVLNNEQKIELDKFVHRKMDIRKELRDVRHKLDEDIETLGGYLKFINIALMPLIITIATLAFSFIRRRKTT